MKSILKFLLYIVISLLLALFIRLFLCNFYRVPSDSMSPTVMVGDFILTDKWTYGARIFTSLKFGKYNDPPMVRVPGLRHIKRNNVVVFNFQYQDYHAAWDTIRMNLSLFFVKRCIGIPGDSLSAVGGYYRITGLTDTVGYIPEQKRLSRFQKGLDSAILQTPAFDSILHWNAINFGPFYIPAAGATIPLTPKSFRLYHKQMVYETGKVIVMKDSAVYINDTLALGYTFRHNWYFMAGDNVMNSQDSRYIGLVPDTYIIGKASMIISSKDMHTGKRRWTRLLKRIK